ncbi:hypothetical protein BO70DRAFT_317309 [Aspergillus heteromorphus CBS 117.55]|uniref:DUF4211 domain-containing protein n=1 Tax=Aspergillus heteromorphus CBS 117.55 TaxID=1448321 RepID=A0A317VU05_9EURO|nr:uncharacterized protein BO70DRAFT_317309 [Aspergillus heteromorphus CBS 117.55]PWY77345.1 hypothetical protein BO70DRAFT_317309 [Aspergillus heteromorphus CBS 117.55]
MPRTYSKKKQTRLAFAPISAPPPKKERESDGEQDRRATLRYAHPSLPTLRRGRSRSDKKSLPTGTETKTENPPRQPTPETAAEAPAAPVQESDSDIEVVRSARKPHKQKSRKRKRRGDSEESETLAQTPAKKIVLDDSDDEEDVVVASHRKLRRGKAARPAVVVVDDDDDDDNDGSEEELVSSPVKRKRRNMSADVPQTPRGKMDQDDLDIVEDLDYLQDSVVRDTRTRGRVANSARAQRQAHLDALRRRRAGKTTESSSEEEEEKSNRPSSNAESSESSDAESDASNEPEKPTTKPRLRNRQEESDIESAIGENDDLDRYEDDFVIEDENDPLGAPTGLEDIPFEFTRHAYKQSKDYFQDTVEWMVHNQLNPAFPRTSPVYKVAFSKIEDEVKGRTGSQLVSSVWNANFCRALLARPQIEITSFPTIEGHPCDACNRSGHPASYDIKLYGKAYSLETLEPLSDEDSDDDDADSHAQERDRDGRTLPDENKRFFLGSHCKTKATLAHTLTHWRIHLNEWVTGYLEHEGYLSDESVLERNHWRQSRKNKYATEVVESMIHNGEVKKLWRDFKINLRTARESSTLG